MVLGDQNNDAQKPVLVDDGVRGYDFRAEANEAGEGGGDRRLGDGTRSQAPDFEEIDIILGARKAAA